MKPNLKIALSVSLITFITPACKKELPHPAAEKIEPTYTSGNAGYKPPKPVDQKKSPSDQPKKNVQNTIDRGRFYTQYGVIDGIRFYSKDGNEVNLEQSKAKGPHKTYNSVTKKGTYFIREELAEGLSRQELVKLGEKEKWPDHIMQGIKPADGNYHY